MLIFPIRRVLWGLVEFIGYGPCGADGPRTIMKKLVCGLCLCWFITVGCSQAARDRLAHWFFEIPDESEGAAAVAPAVPVYEPPRASLPAVRFASFHPPFVTRECRECHDATQRMQVRDDLLDSCRGCHGRFFSEEVGHAPVEEGLCTECHDSHRTERPFLLKMDVFDLCIECHDEPEDLSEPAHAVEEVEQCTACHDPHFGTSPLLRPEPAIEIPDQSQP